MTTNVEKLQADVNNLQNVVKNINEYLMGIEADISSINIQIQDIVDKDSISHYNKRLEQMALSSAEISRILGDGQDSLEKDIDALTKKIRSISKTKRDLGSLIDSGIGLVDRIDALGELQDRVSAVDKVTDNLSHIDSMGNLLGKLNEDLTKVYSATSKLCQSADKIAALNGENLKHIDKGLNKILANIDNNNLAIKQKIEAKLNDIQVGSNNNDAILEQIDDALDLTNAQQIALSGFFLEIKSIIGNANDNLTDNISEMKSFAEQIGSLFNNSLERAEDSNDKLIMQLNSFATEYNNISEDINSLKDVLLSENLLERQSKLEASLEELLNKQQENQPLQQEVAALQVDNSTDWKAINEFIAYQKDVNDKIQDKQLQIMDMMDNLVKSQQALKLQQDTILERQQQQLNTEKDLEQQENGTVKVGFKYNIAFVSLAIISFIVIFAVVQSTLFK